MYKSPSRQPSVHTPPRARPGRALQTGLFSLLVVLQPLALTLPAHSAQPQPRDSRLVQGNSSPAWLDAIVRFQVPGVRFKDGKRRHHLEDCSATLVSAHPQRPADTLITAWHCLEMYKDLGKALTVTLRSNGGADLTREVYRVADGGGMHADWAILRIYNALPAGSVTALSIDPDTADRDRPITMAGFSRDAGLGGGGEFLTFDPACRITAIERNATATDCAAHKGASGGAVVQLSTSGAPLLTGVISQGNGEDYSSFVPVAHFRTALELHLGRSFQPRF